MKISVCIPMYNESRIIEQSAKDLSRYMQECFDDYEILFCDDGSRDGCAELVRALALPNVRVIGYSDNRGKGSAVREAMLEATGEIRLFTDADLAYGTDLIVGTAVFVGARGQEFTDCGLPWSEICTQVTDLWLGGE